MHTINLDKIQKSAKCKIRVMFIRISLSGYYVRKVCIFIYFFCFCRSLFAHLARFFSSCAYLLLRLSFARVTAFAGEIKWFSSEFGLFGVYVVGSFSSLLEFTFFCILFVFYLVFSDKKYLYGVNCALSLSKKKIKRILCGFFRLFNLKLLRGKIGFSFEKLLNRRVRDARWKRGQ